MCFQGLQATPRPLIVDFEGEVCNFKPLAAPDREQADIHDSPAPNSAPHSAFHITLGVCFKGDLQI